VGRQASGSEPSANQQRRWIAPSTLRTNTLPSSDNHHDYYVFRRVRGILNKITPEKFEKLSGDIQNIIGHGSPTVFKGVILLIFEKAIDEPKYSSMYAQLCKRLSEDAPNFEPPGSKITTFKRLLLINCRDEFENRAALSATFERKTGTLTGEEEEAKFIAKRKMLGNIKFIGELGKLEMLHDSTIHKCCEHLLVGRKKQPIAEQAEDLECLAHLFKTCGRIIDSPKAKLLVDQYFQRIDAVIANHDTPTRIKFLLQDVIDMRANRWVPRKLATQDGPRPIQQVREDAAREGCIYMPQQDNQGPGGKGTPGDQHASRLEKVLLSNSRGKGMEDIFGGPAPRSSNSLGLGTGPGVIGEGSNEYGYDNYSRNGHSHHHEDKYNSNYNNSNSYNNRDESRGHDYKPKRDSYNDNKYVERPDFGDRFTANRNKTHPSNRGGGRGNGLGGRDSARSNGGGSYNNSYDKNSPSSDRDMAPRFKKMDMYGSTNGRSSNGDIQLRPANGNLMLKPKTPAILPKSARLDNGPAMQPNNGAMTMSVLEPVYISKKGGDKNKGGQGPTRDEVFSKVEEVLSKLVQTCSTNEAFTIWKDSAIPNKMVNNALIHMFKKVVKMEEEPQRVLTFQLIDQLVVEEVITQVHCKESLARIIQGLGPKDLVDLGGVVDLATWSLTSTKAKLVDVADMTDGGATHPLFLSILQKLANNSEDTALAMFTESGVVLLDQLPPDMRTEHQLGQVLEEKKLTLLVPLLSIKTELRKQLAATEDKILPTRLQEWILSNVDEKYQEDPGFVFALMDAIIRHIVESTENNCTADKENNEAEKERIRDFKPLLKTFLKASSHLQLSCIYALQVYCESKGFPKGLMLRWFMALYENDVIEEQSFLKWKEDVNDTYPGKGKALFQVNQWLTWLEEAESEEDEDEE
jgi:translation initiation factor 4G